MMITDLNHTAFIVVMRENVRVRMFQMNPAHYWKIIR